jgi:putative aldouronate transport system permease protein
MENANILEGSSRKSKREIEKESKQRAKEMRAFAEQLNPRSFKEKAHDLFLSIWDHRVFYLMLLPAIVLLIIFAYVPMYGVVLAFKEYSPRAGILGSEWVGLKNFETVFALDGFWNAFRNTIYINVLKLVVSFPASIILAVMLNAVKNKILKNSIQTLVYLPHFVSWIVVAGLIFSLFNEKSGSIYNMFKAFGVTLDVFTNGSQFLALIVCSDLWKEVGWGAIIYLAALSGINADLYEASEIDGANKLKQFFHITLPQLMPTISIMLILRVGGLIGGGFDQIYNLYNTTVYDVADVLDTFIYRNGISNSQFSLGTAVGLFENLANIFLLLFANKVVSFINRDE